MDAAGIAAVAAAAVVIIGALATAAVKIITAIRVGFVKTAAVNSAQTVKLDNITTLVDGQYSAVLTKLAEVQRTLADVTGRRADRDSADAAEKTAGEHVARTNAVNERTANAGTAKEVVP